MKKLLLILLIVSAQISFSQNKVLATVGNEAIMLDEYKTRYELMPHISGENQNIDSVKNNFLYTLIAEKLWALEAESNGVANNDMIVNSLAPLEKIYVRDALFKLEIEPKLNITRQVLDEATRRAGLRLRVGVITSKDKNAINQAYELLCKRTPFDTVVAIAKNNKLEKYQGFIKFGDMEEEHVEDTLYALMPGKFTTPIANKQAFFIFFLYEKQFVTPDEANEGKGTQRSVKDIVRERRSRKYGTEYLATLLKNAKVNLDTTLIRTISNNIAEIAIDKKNKMKGTDTIEVYVGEPELTSLMKKYGADTLAMPIIKFVDGSITVKDFMYELIFDALVFKRPTVKSVFVKTFQKIQQVAEREFITKEGYKKGLQNSPEIQKELRLWKENFYSQYSRNRFFDTLKVNENELYNYFLTINNDFYVRALEVVSHNLDDIQNALKDNTTGVKFNDIVLKYSENKNQPALLSDTSFAPVSSFGKYSTLIGRLNVGEVYGPIPDSGSFHLFKLLDKKADNPAYKNTYEQLKGELSNMYKYNKLDSLYNNYTAKLAIKYNVSVDMAAVKDAKLSEINMFTHRYMGFGGRIAAAPYSTPWYQWYKKFLQLKQLNP